MADAKHTPTFRQMRARMNSAHRQLLEAARDGVKISTPSHSAARGYMTARATLIDWGCMEGEHITSLGLNLLNAAIAKATGAQP